MDFSLFISTSRLSTGWKRRLWTGALLGVFFLSTSPPGFGEGVGCAGGRYRDGVYTAGADGYQGVLEVAVRVEDGWIQSVRVVKNPDNLAPALLEKLAARIVESQGTRGVDAVTGATITTRALIDAVDKALSRAQS
jgi:uncharacterized protein with FMN-binding domain